MPDTQPPLILRKRPDLVVTQETFGDKLYHVVKDPLALRYFRFLKEEFVQLDLLDGTRSLDALQTELETRFAPQQFPTAGIARFVAGLHQAGLVTSDARGQAAPLLERRGKSRRKQLLQKLLSPTAIQLRGVDPTRFLDRLIPWTRWCFSRWTAATAVVLILAAVGLAAVQYDEVRRRLPGFQEFFTPGNMLLLLGLTGAIKIVHEIGHGLTCRRFGGECPEVGLMFLMFAPCLYCNVSDAWRLTKWRRIAVSFAGIAVELVIAALAVFGWWFSAPGAFQQLCLGAVFVSGLSTLAINGNPLMRYDGYFVLADLVETPNLAEKSSAVIREYLSRLCWGTADDRDPLLPQRSRGWFALYGVASLVYRILITFSIYLFLLEWLRPYRLEVLARIFGLSAVVTMAVVPAVRNGRLIWSKLSAEDDGRNRRRRRLTFAVTAAAIAVGVIVPLPHRVWGTLEVQPHDAVPLYVDVTGVLKQVVVRPGDRVRPGTHVATLENLDLELEIAQLRGRCAELAAQLGARRLERYQSVAAGQEIPELEQSLAAARETLAKKEGDQRRLTLVAAAPGVVLPPAENMSDQQVPQGELPTWSGLPSDRRNLTATLEAGTLFCRIGETNRWEAVVVVDQADIELVAVGQRAEVRVEQLPDVTILGTVDEIARRELQESPKGLSNKAGGDLATATDASGIERPLSATYQVRIVLADPDSLLRTGLRGTARIHVPATPLAARVGSWLGRTFHFQL